MSNKFDKDFEAITNDSELTEEGTKFIEAVKQFVGTQYDSEDLAKLIVLIMAALDVDDNAFNTAISALYQTAIEVQTGINLNELLDLVTKGEPGLTH
ncbi:hypothetical protein P4H14_28470 [Bacillus cereus]|uniref:Uncharacterized protein n=3 Tax=Bacillus cereus group TaxID=86661 RepID=A0A9W5VNA3_BACCE|nr:MULTISPECIES: hypothetical protein [Bacillus cereus group]MDA2112220.1 hypothetical protein [Bacillus cereus]AFQ16483.1 hypothetical protein BTG_15165 [Bacillus thuringiensis HD-771]AND10501.1 hypothetical protein Bt4C1_25925 [Bacillus thuringiensis serovar alesti]EOP94816.1 hypothetical protein IGM_01248 [Bacillus cereus HuB4-4]MBG9633644.1 hypothetical protein [Bacillus thuringiensis]